LKPVEAELDEQIQEAVLSLPVKLEDGSLATVGGLVQRAADSLRVANEAIRGNALIATTAAFLMKQEKRRGNPAIYVRLDGTVALRISYDEDEEEDPILPVAKPAQKSKLPSIDELRERAERLNVDIEDLGRAKLKIIKRLDDAEQSGESSLSLVPGR